MSMELNTAIALQNLQSGHTDAITKRAAAAKQEDRFDEVAREFEAVFIAEMMKPMFEGLDVDPMFGGGKGEEVFRSMLVQEYGKIMAETGQIGIAASVKAQLIEMQAIAGGTPEATDNNDSNEESASDDTRTSL